MKPFYLGIDAGSTMCKGVLMNENKILDAMMIPSGWNTKNTTKIMMEEIFKRNQVKQEKCHIIATGYGRDTMDFSEKSITEISAHAFGGIYLHKDLVGIIDIGGQDSKVIVIKNNRPVDFVMNDKCAAGTGRFLEISCNKLGIPMKSIDEFIKNKKSVPINNMCAVFAESEIINHLAASKDRAEILNGVIESIGIRISALVKKVTQEKAGTYLMTGGLARSEKMVKSIENAIHSPVVRHELSPYAGAIGAAYVFYREVNKMQCNNNLKRGIHQ